MLISYPHFNFRYLLGFLLLLACINAQAEPNQQDHLVVLMYHHVAENTPPSTSLSPSQFIQHLQLIEELELEVVDLVDAMERLQQGQNLPKGAVALTFDDAWENVLINAHPELVKRGWPYTMFVATQPVDQGLRGSLSWDQLRSMHQQGVRLLNHTHSHPHLAHQVAEPDWLERAMADIEQGQQRLEDELGTALPKILAYPYGEHNTELKQALAAQGYIAFGQHSGPLSANLDWQALPRYPAAGIYANIDTLKPKLLSRPLPVLDYQAANPQGQSNPPQLLLKVNTQEFHAPFLRCYAGSEVLEPVWISEQEFSVQASRPMPAGRSRYNCAVNDRQGRALWLSQPWLMPRADGSYPEE